MMNELVRGAVLAEFEKATGRPVRWVEEGVADGDFEDRVNTIEVFDVQDFHQRAMFSALRPLRQRARNQLGQSVRIVFHTPQATTRYYAKVRPDGYQVPLTIVPSSAQPSRGVGLVDDDVLGDSRPPRSRVA
jgi:hypothetical protein